MEADWQIIIPIPSIPAHYLGSRDSSRGQQRSQNGDMKLCRKLDLLLYLH